MSVWLWEFWIFSFGGWVLERGFAAATRSAFRRRRCLLLEPLCPVYGLGVLAVLALPPALRTGWRLYVWGGLTATAVEYVFHWWGERFLGVRFWDYSRQFGNLHGRVCLPFSLAWGVLMFPAVQMAALTAFLARRIPWQLTWCGLLLFTADAVCTLRFLAVTHDLEQLRAALPPALRRA